MIFLTLNMPSATKDCYESSGNCQGISHVWRVVTLMAAAACVTSASNMAAVARNKTCHDKLKLKLASDREKLAITCNPDPNRSMRWNCHGDYSQFLLSSVKCTENIIILIASSIQNNFSLPTNCGPLRNVGLGPQVVQHL